MVKPNVLSKLSWFVWEIFNPCADIFSAKFYVQMCVVALNYRIQFKVPIGKITKILKKKMKKANSCGAVIFFFSTIIAQIKIKEIEK